MDAGKKVLRLALTVWLDKLKNVGSEAIIKESLSGCHCTSVVVLRWCACVIVQVVLTFYPSLRVV